jgi:hypothetical protein
MITGCKLNAVCGQSMETHEYIIKGIEVEHRVFL